MRAAVLVPWAIPTIVSAKMWGWMLHDQFGVINQWLFDAGLMAQKSGLDRRSGLRALDRGRGRRLEDHALHGAADPGRAADPAQGLLRGCARRRRPSAARVLEGHAAADPSRR